MIYQCALTFLTFLVLSNGFLLDDKTTPKSVNSEGLDENRYTALVNLLIAEREDRIKLEKEVAILKADLLATQQGLTELYHSHTNLNKTYATLQIQFDSLRNALNSTQHHEESQFKISLNTTTKQLEERLDTLQQQISNQTNRVSLTASVHGNTYNRGQNIRFSYIYTKNGVGSNVTSSLNNNGIFTCEKAGLYMISVFMTTDTHQRSILLYKNNDVLAYLYFSLNGYIQTDAATVVEQLHIGDTLTVKPSGGSMYVYGDRESCLSILQIAN